jgi:hypothetical protein
MRETAHLELRIRAFHVILWFDLFQILQTVSVNDREQIQLPAMKLRVRGGPLLGILCSQGLMDWGK